MRQFTSLLRLTICGAILLIASCASVETVQNGGTPNQIAWIAFLHRHSKQGEWSRDWMFMHTCIVYLKDSQSYFRDHPVVDRPPGDNTAVSVEDESMKLNDQQLDELINKSTDQELIALHNKMTQTENALFHSKEYAQMTGDSSHVQLIDRSYGIDVRTNMQTRQAEGEAIAEQIQETGQMPAPKSAAEVAREDQETARDTLARQKDPEARKADSAARSSGARFNALRLRLAIPLDEFLLLARKYTPSGSKGWMCTIREDPEENGSRTYGLLAPWYGTWVY